MILFKDGTKETRHIVDEFNTEYQGLTLVLDNGDGTYENFIVLEYYSGSWDDPIVETSRSKISLIKSIDDDDTTLEERRKYLKYKIAKEMKSIEDFYKKDNGFYAFLFAKKYNIPFEVEIVSGRKYPKGTRFICNDYSEYCIPNTYGKKRVYYIHSDDKQIKVNSDNCRIINYGNVEKTLEEQFRKTSVIIDNKIYHIWK